MILGRAAVMKKRSAQIIEDIIKCKVSLIVPPYYYTNDDINKLVDSRYEQLYKEMNDKLDVEFQCNKEAKK